MIRKICLILLLGLCSLPLANAQDDKGAGDKKKKEGAGRPELKGLSPDEREAKRKEMRERMQKQLAELRKKKADGTLSEADKKRLERMEELDKRFDQSAPRAGATNKIGKEIKGPAGK
jgi:hypothetical protein